VRSHEKCDVLMCRKQHRNAHDCDYDVLFESHRKLSKRKIIS
jgi:hypothetical protein